MSRLNPEMHPLLNEIIIKALFVKNIYTVLQFIETEIKHIGAVTNLKYKDILDIRKHLINKHSAVVNNGLDYYNELITKSTLFPTGIQSLDKILQGLMTGNIYEICGLPASGKTQFCLTVMKNVVQQLNLYVYIIDTKKDFSGTKIRAMLDAANVSKVEMERIMSKMLVKQTDTTSELLNSLYEIKNLLYKRQLKLRLLIIDSLPPLFYQTEDYESNYSVMNDLINVLFFLAKEFHLAVIVTNLVTIWYEGNFQVESTTTEKLGLGKFWFNIPNTRLMIKKNDETNLYEFVILKSNCLPKDIRCSVTITDAGFI